MTAPAPTPAGAPPRTKTPPRSKPARARPTKQKFDWSAVQKATDDPSDPFDIHWDLSTKGSVLLLHRAGASAGGLARLELARLAELAPIADCRLVDPQIGSNLGVGHVLFPDEPDPFPLELGRVLAPGQDGHPSASLPDGPAEWGKVTPLRDPNPIPSLWPPIFACPEPSAPTPNATAWAPRAPHPRAVGRPSPAMSPPRLALIRTRPPLPARPAVAAPPAAPWRAHPATPARPPRSTARSLAGTCGRRTAGSATDHGRTF